MNEEEFVLKVSLDLISAIYKNAEEALDEASVLSERHGAIDKVTYALKAPWCLILAKEDGDTGVDGAVTYTVESFDDQSSCAERVAELYSTGIDVVHILKNGVPRRNVRVEVRARFR